MNSELQAVLSNEVTAIAFCWRLTRGDGVVIGFTSHNRDLAIGSVVYLARPGMTPSAISQTAEPGVDSMGIHGVLDDAAISAFDLEAGKWNGAKVELFLCDWSQPDLGWERLFVGEIGEIVRPLLMSGGDFQVQLVSDAVRIERAGPFRLTPMCRAELGDGRCGVDMQGRRISAIATEVSENRVHLEEPLEDAGRFIGGRLRFVSGPLCGVDRRIITAEDGELILDEELPEADMCGKVIWIYEGCDKRLATCSARFGNAAFFDGEPHLPGTDALIRYAEG